MLRSVISCIIDVSDRGRPEYLAAFRKYESAYRMKVRILGRINFLEECLSNDICPNFTHFKIPDSSVFRYEDVQRFKLTLTRQQLCEAYKEKQKNEDELASARDDFRVTFHHFAGFFLPAILTSGRIVQQQLNSTHRKKLENLSEQQDRPLFAIESSVVNISDVDIPPKFMRFLQRGPRNPILRKFNAADSFVQFEKLAKFLVDKGAFPNEVRSRLSAICHSYCKHPENRKYDRTAYSFRNFLRSNNLVALPFDKGCGMVVMKEAQYKQKMEVIFSGPEFNEVSKIGRYKKPVPMAKEDQFNNVLSSIHLSDKLEQSLRSSGGYASRMYGTAKIHKEQVPLRPIASCNGSINEGLSRYLAKILSKLPESNINCTAEEVCELITDQVHNMDGELFMVSYDVVSLFTKVPLEEALEAAVGLVEHADVLPEGLLIEQFREMLYLATKDSLVEFNGKYYLQTGGFAMGNTLAVLLSNIFMVVKVEALFDEKGIHPKLYKRYVDDLFMLTRSSEEADLYFTILKSLHPSINFTMEKEMNGRLAFLDILIIRENGKFKTEIYRKPTDTGLMLNYLAVAPQLFKRNLVIGEAIRVTKRCSEFYDKNRALMALRERLKKNQYPDRFVDRCFREALGPAKSEPSDDSGSEEETEDDRNKHIFALEYRGKHTELFMKKVRRVIDRDDVRYVYRTSKAKDFFGNKSPVPDDLRSKVIYLLLCDCRKQYAGSTKRHLVTREREHIRSDKRSSFYKHKAECPLDYTIEILDSARTNWDLRIKEAYYIAQRKPALNEKQEYDYKVSITPPET